MAVFRLLAAGTALAAVAAGALTSAAGPASPSAGAAAVPARATGCASPGAGWTLSPTRTVATGQQGLGQPDLAVSRTGRATTTWQGRPHEQANLDVYAADVPGTDGPRSLTAGANVWAMFPSPNLQIGQDARGAQTVMWVQEGRTPDGDGTGYTLTRAGRADLGNWSAPIAVAPEGGLVMGQELVVNASGGGLIAWREYLPRSAYPVVYTSFRRSAAASWQRPVRRLPGVSTLKSHIGIDDHGNALLVFGSTKGVIEAVRRIAGRGWGKPQHISGPRSTTPTVAVSSSGGAVVAWRTYDSNDRYDASFTARMTSAGRWQPPVLRADGRAVPFRGLDIDGRGRALAAWWRGADLTAMWSRPDGTWRRPFVLAARQDSPERPRLRVVVNRRGDALVAWRVGIGGDDPRLRARYRPTDGHWSPPARLTPPGVQPRSYGVAVGDCGHAAVSWTTRDGSVQIRRATPTP